MENQSPEGARDEPSIDELSVELVAQLRQKTGQAWRVDSQPSETGYTIDIKLGPGQYMTLEQLLRIPGAEPIYRELVERLEAESKAKFRASPWAKQQERYPDHDGWSFGRKVTVFGSGKQPVRPTSQERSVFRTGTRFVKGGWLGRWFGRRREPVKPERSVEIPPRRADTQQFNAEFDL